MLSDLLDLTRQGGTRRISDLAEELDTTPRLIEAMLDDLTRMGYVKPVASNCSERCARCPMSDTCAAGGPPDVGGRAQIWVLTEDQTAW
ncbi:MAG: FeoC-like transcriptional regulator [Anaerolineae bacterium]|jgi:hypothetical protein